MLTVYPGHRSVEGAPTELFFSEYIEGTSNNKALEIFNGTGAAVNLSAGSYQVQIFSNGSTTPSATISLTGTVANNDVFVLSHSSASATILAQADQTAGNVNFNGDDAVALLKGSAMIDVIGQIGTDPGTEWGTGLTSTADNTLLRKGNIQAGDANGSDAFDPSIEWNGLATDTFTDLGSHTLSPTAVEMESFKAAMTKEGIFLQWQTGLEVNNLGFNIYRDHRGRRERINPELLAGSALIAGNDLPLTAGREYAWLDETGEVDSLYWIEDIDTDGTTRLHGPLAPESKMARLPKHIRTASLSRLGVTRVETIPAARSDEALDFALPGERGNLQWEIAAGRAVKIAIREEGWYRVAQPELAAAGLAPGADPRKLRLFLRGQELPLLVAGERDGRFDPSDSIEFYAVGADTPYSDAHTYWLVAGSSVGKRVGLTQSRSARGGAQNFTLTIESRERSVYFAALKNGEAENFFGRAITSQPAEHSVTLHHLDSTFSGQAEIEVSLQGVTELEGPADHQVGVFLNGERLGRMVFDGRARLSERFVVSHSLLREGANMVSLAAEGGPMDVSLFDHVRLTHRHTCTADDGQLKMTVAGAPGPQTISGFASPLIRVFDITNPLSVQEIAGRIEGQGASYSVSVEVAGARTLLAIAADRVKRPAMATANVPSLWRSLHHQADMVIISDRRFMPALSALRSLRERQGLRVAMVDIEDIYDEFSYGEKDPRAVKGFLQWAATLWQSKPRLALLVGDSSFDPRDYLRLGASDLVPTKLIDSEFLETASDDWFVDFDSDSLPEMAIGRLPARTATEAAAMAARIVSFEQRVSIDRALVVADRGDGYDFEAASRRLEAAMPGLEIAEVFRSRFDDQTARKEIADRISEGVLVVSYSGHGSVATWRGNLLTSSDAPGPSRAPAMFVTATCLNGYFHDPAVDGLAEALMKSPRAFAVWASSALTRPSDQTRLAEEFLRRALSRERNFTLGEAAMMAKRAISDADIRRTWILFGDPATRLR
jgi:hypothetical protein